MSYDRRRHGTRIVPQAEWKEFIKYLKKLVPEISHIHDSALPFFFYPRRVNMEYIIPDKGELEDDPLVDEEGLYPAIIIPEPHGDKRVAAVRIKEKVRHRGHEGPDRVDEYIFGRDTNIVEMIDTDSEEEPFIFIQEVVKRYVVGAKSRSYYEKDRWYANIESDFAQLCHTLVFPKEFVGDIVGLINLGVV